MNGKRVVVGQSEWGIADGKAADVIAQIKSAMENDAVVALQLLDKNGTAVTVYFNGKAVPTVEVDIDSDPRPSEING